MGQRCCDAGSIFSPAPAPLARLLPYVASDGIRSVDPPPLALVLAARSTVLHADNTPMSEQLPAEGSNAQVSSG